LADILTYYQSGDIAFYQIDSEILSMFKISSEEQLKKVSDKLFESFKKESMM